MAVLQWLHQSLSAEPSLLTMLQFWLKVLKMLRIANQGQKVVQVKFIF